MEKAGTLPELALPLRAATRLKALGLLVLLGIIYALRPFVIVRFGRLIAHRIGHLAANTECYLCEKDFRINTPKRVFDIWIPGKPANSYLLKMYERIIFTWNSSIPAMLCEGAKFLDWWHEHEFSNASMGRDIFNLFEKIPPHLSFTKSEEKRGQAGLRALGIPEGAKWVCLIVRDSAYLGEGSEYHNFRDSDVKTYSKAAKALKDRGYYVVRMGAKVSVPFDDPNVIDYASIGRSEFMDVYLGAKCAFCITNSTGFDAIPMIFRRPLCVVNMVPVEYLQTYLKDSIAIWKHHYKDGKRMSFEEIIESGAGKFLSSEEFENASIKLQDNSPDEIADAAIEMSERIDSKAIDQLELHTYSGVTLAEFNEPHYQKEFWDSFPRSDSSYTGMPLHGRINMRIGSKFLNHLR